MPGKGPDWILFGVVCETQTTGNKRRDKDMHQVFIGKREYKCPSRWEELSGDQMAGVAAVLHSPISEAEALIRITLILMEAKKHFWLKFNIVYRLSAEARYDLIAVARWVLYEPNTCTDNKLPVIRTRGSYGAKLYGPLRECRRFTFMEFIEADTAYLNFRTNFNNRVAREEALNRLVAILYRHENPDRCGFPTPLPWASLRKSRRLRGSQWNGDPREEFNSNVIEYHMKLVSRVPDKYKYAILLFYDACHTKWAQDHPNIFKKADSKKGSGSGWSNALLSLAGGSINIDKMMKVNAAAALRDLDNKILEQEKLEFELEKSKSNHR